MMSDGLPDCHPYAYDSTQVEKAMAGFASDHGILVRIVYNCEVPGGAAGDPTCCLIS